MDLTKSQRRAVEHEGRNLQLIACAGSGKTEVVARRVVHLLTPGRPGTLEPRNIVAFTFTDKAAAELKERIVTRTREALGEIHGMADLFVGTIHAFCLDLLRAEAPKYLKYEVLNEVQQALFVDRHSRKKRPHRVDGPPGAPAQALRRHQPLRERAGDPPRGRSRRVEAGRLLRRRRPRRIPGPAQGAELLRLLVDSRSRRREPDQRRRPAPAARRKAPLRHRRRVPGREPDPGGDRLVAARPGRTGLRRGRRRPDHLPVARQRRQRTSSRSATAIPGSTASGSTTTSVPARGSSGRRARSSNRTTSASTRP